MVYGYPALGLLRNKGKGEFIEEVLGNYHLEGMGDFDGDGDIDIWTIPIDMIIEESRLALGILVNRGDGSFEEIVTVEKFGYAPNWAEDFNGDRAMDLVWRASEEPYGRYILTLNDGAGHLEEIAKWNIDIDVRNIAAIKDLEGDGDLDMVASIEWHRFMASPGGLQILWNKAGAMEREIVYTVDELEWSGGGTGKRPIGFGDLNCDGLLDMAIPSISDVAVIVLLGKPGGGFREEGRYPVSGDPELIEVADFDGDGDLDLAVADGTGQGVSILLNQSNPATEVEEGPSGIPLGWELGQAYPNPFNTRVVIPFEVGSPGKVEIGIYDVKGRSVRSLVEGEIEPGRWKVFWDGRDERGNPVASGVYVIRMEAGSRTWCRKVALIR
ncbi:MAG: hypothetical protein DRN95_06435 [Candidatus Hydrothermarchaeota archaeon]|nr:MAG: hypothetical protein DRN95_06435 [Candidatus Hydrothermarchaeota archaeon]